MPDWIDGNWFDMATLVVAIVYSLARCHRAGSSRSWERFVGDISYGVIIFPMLLLSFTVFSKPALEFLMEGNRVIISLSGFFTLVVVLKRSFEKAAASATIADQSIE